MRLLAHELGNPVAAIRMSAEMIQSTVPPEMQEQLSTMILEEAIHLEELIERALFYASIGQPRCVEIDVAELLGSAAQQFPTARVSVAAISPALKITGDRGQLGRMISEPISNAIEANATSISLNAVLDGDSIVFSISDNGEGVSTAASTRLFEPFYTSREGKLGLGLTIARRIAALHGGSGEACSGAVSGTVMSYRIPTIG